MRSHDTNYFEITCPELTIESEIEKGAKRKDVALTYALALRTSVTVDWIRIHAAILKRWSPNALRWIKSLAWAYYEGRKSPVQ